MKETIDQVREFHEVYGSHISKNQDIQNKKVNELRVNLLKEEVNELEEKLEVGDATGVLDALTDIQYVLDGAYISLGFDKVKNPAFEEVHRSNMSKLGLDGKPIKREDGKILKGPNYTEPNLEQFIEKPFDYKNYSSKLQDVENEIAMEVFSAKRKWPKDFNNYHEAYAVILEEIDEMWEEIKLKNPDRDKIRHEAIQVAAMINRLLIEL